MNNRNSFNPLWFILLFIGAIALLSNFSTTLLLALLVAVAFWAYRNANLGNLREGLDLFQNGNLFRNERLPQFDDEDDYYEDEEETNAPSATREPMYRHALSAVENAGLNPDQVQVLAVDLGVMAYRRGEQPTVYRTWSVPNDADALQPFVSLRVPTKAVGNVKFELVDAYGKSLFIHEQAYNLDKGRNFLSPPARMPVRELAQSEGRWQLKISADDVLLAVHHFEFATATTANIRKNLGEDGEIATDSRLMMDESPMPKMSLDDLLAYQDENEKARRK